MAQIKKLAKQTAIYGIPSIVGRFLNFLLVPLYTYTFAPEAYGIVTEFYTYTALLMVLLTYGMETTFFRYVHKCDDRSLVYSTGLWSLFFTSSCFFLLVFLLKDRIGTALGYPYAADYVLWFALILVADVMAALPFCLLREQNKAFRFAWLKTVNIAVNIGLNLFFILFCPAWIEAHPASVLRHIYVADLGVGYIFISNLIASVVTILLLWPEWHQLRFRFDRRLWKSMMGYALPIMIWGLAGIVDSTFDRLLIRYLTPDTQVALAQVGIYGACYKLSIIMTLFVQAFRFAAEPFFFKQAADADAKQTYAAVMKYFVITCALIYMGCVLFLDQILYFIGADYREGRGVVPVLLMAQLFLGIFYNLSVWYKVMDRTRVGMYISLIGATLNLSLNFLLIPYFGYVGAAWTALISYVAMTLISYIWGQKCYKVPYSVLSIGAYILAAVLLGGLGEVLPFTRTWQGIAFGLVCLMGFSAYVLYREKALRQMFLKILRR